MLKNNIFISVFVMIFGIAGISTAVELSSNQIAGQSNIPAQAAGTELCTSCTSGQISAVDNKCGNTGETTGIFKYIRGKGDTFQ